MNLPRIDYRPAWELTDAELDREFDQWQRLLPSDGRLVEAMARRRAVIGEFVRRTAHAEGEPLLAVQLLPAGARMKRL